MYQTDGGVWCCARRSRGGEFGDNVEELDDSVGECTPRAGMEDWPTPTLASIVTGQIWASLERNGFLNDTLVFLTSDNVRGPRARSSLR